MTGCDQSAQLELDGVTEQSCIPALCLTWLRRTMLRQARADTSDLDAFGPSHPVASYAALCRFAAKVTSGTPPCHRQTLGACHLWTGAVNHNGYGHFYADGKVRRAHVVAWEIANYRRVPGGLVVMHDCDNRRCVNPHHLRVGTPKDNTRDMLDKSRQDFPKGDRSGRRKHPGSYPVGELCRSSKLTVEAVTLIRADERSSRAVARDFGVTHNTVNLIRGRKLWRHVP